MDWGGKREGAGRPLEKGERRKGRNIRATDNEWKMIYAFAKLIKRSDKSAFDFIQKYVASD